MGKLSSNIPYLIIILKVKKKKSAIKTVFIAVKTIAKYFLLCNLHSSPITEVIGNVRKEFIFQVTKSSS